MRFLFGISLNSCPVRLSRVTLFSPMILIAFGSNLAGVAGNSVDTLCAAVRLLAQNGVVVDAASGLYETPPVGPGRQGNYCNAVASVRTKHGPATLLALLARIEKQCGRRPGPRWSARVLDLDLLAYGRMVSGWSGDINTLRLGSEAASMLILPHPRMDIRPFVLRPLIDIAPDWRHPVKGRRAQQLWNSVRRSRDARKITRISGPEWVTWDRKNR